MSPVPLQMWQRRAQCRCRCGRGGPSSGADVAGIRDTDLSCLAMSAARQGLRCTVSSAQGCCAVDRMEIVLAAMPAVRTVVTPRVVPGFARGVHHMEQVAGGGEREAGRDGDGE